MCVVVACVLELSSREPGAGMLATAFAASIFAAAAAALPAAEIKETVGGGPRYTVQLLTGALAPSSRPPPGSKSMVMTKKGGKKYRCHLPNSDQATADASVAMRPAAPRVASYLQPLKGTCFYRLEGWWTYEFCFQKGLRQFHQEKVKATATKPESTTVTQEYILGAWPPPPPSSAPADAKSDGDEQGGDALGSGTGATGDASSTTAAAGDGDASGAEATAGSVSDELMSDAKTRKKYWSQTYGNGTLCGITNKPRETEVRLQCGALEPSFLESVEEVATCKYRVHFSTNLLCRHPGFAADESKDEVHTIQCEPLGPDGVPIPAPKRSAAAAAAAERSASDGRPAARAAEERVGAVAGGAAEEGDPGSSGGGKDVGAVRGLFDVGECMLHLKYNYRGVIVGYDRECVQSEAWIRANGVDGLKHGRKQPFYHVLADTRDRPGSPVTYVAHENLLHDTPPLALTHPLLSDFFTGFDAPHGRFIPSDELRARFPREGQTEADVQAAAAAEGDAGQRDAPHEDADDDMIAALDRQADPRIAAG